MRIFKSANKKPLNEKEVEIFYDLLINALTAVIIIALGGCMVASNAVNKLKMSPLYSASNWTIVIILILLAIFGHPIYQLLVLRHKLDERLYEKTKPVIEKILRIKESRMWTLVACSSIIICCVAACSVFYYFRMPSWHEVENDLEWIVHNRRIARLLWHSTRVLALMAIWNWVYVCIRQANLD